LQADLPAVLQQLYNGDNGERYAVLADFAFAASERIVTLYRANQIQNEEQAAFNKVATGARVSVEQFFWQYE
jgi:hypothetical protein